MLYNNTTYVVINQINQIGQAHHQPNPLPNYHITNTTQSPTPNQWIVLHIMSDTTANSDQHNQHNQPSQPSQTQCVFVESPYSGDVDRNLRYLMLCNIDAFARNEMATSSHSFMTTHPAAQQYFVSDYAPEWDIYTRDQAIHQAHVLRKRCDLTVFYVDLGWSSGMKVGKAYCDANNLPYDVRTVDMDRVLSFNSTYITRELVLAILGGKDYTTMLRCADPTQMAK